MKLGAEPQKIVLLSVLGLVLGYVVWDNLLSSDVPESAAPVPRPVAVTPPAGGGPNAAANAERKGPNVARRRDRQTVQEFRPSLLPKRGQNGEVLRTDPMSIDPTLRLDLLAKVQAVTYGGPGRNLFEFGTAPPPEAKPVNDPKIAINKPGPPKPTFYANGIGPSATPPPPPPPPPEPTAPPIPLKFYGYAGPRGSDQRVFLIEGEEIFVVRAGDVVKSRYKVVRITTLSVEMADTQFPKDKPQTIRIQEEPPPNA